MKITNKTLGWGIVLVAAVVVHYLATYGSTYDERYCSACVGDVRYNLSTFTLVMRAVCAAIWALLATSLVGGGIEFSIALPTPLANYRKTLKAKKELNKAIGEKWAAMAKATGPEFDRIDDERVKLEMALENLETK